MKFGIRLPNSGPLATRENMVKVAEEAEKLGFDSIWVHDHILWGTEQHRTHLSAGSAEALDKTQGPNFYESITTLSYIAGRTTNVRLGIAVLVVPLRNPVVLAKQLANLDVMSEGRLIVGVAPGAPNITRPEFDAVGMPYGERGEITDEYIKALKRIWSENQPSFSGKYVNFREVQIFPKPVQKYPKILVGGGERGISPRALKRVIEIGDGWIPAYLTREEIREGIRLLKVSAGSMGGDSEKYVIVHEMFALVDEDSETARGLAAKSLSTNFESVDEGEKRSLIGNPKQLAEKLQAYSEAGVHLTELKFVYGDLPALMKMMKLFADRVAPYVN